MKNPPKIFSKINTAIPLPCHPRVLIKLNRLCDSGTATSRDITRLATMDPALTIKIMRLHGGEEPKTSSLNAIEQVVSQLGPGTIKNVALFCLSNPLSNPLLWKTDANFNQFWFHSLRCAVIARLLSEHLAPELADDAYIAGLLHDVGKLLLWSNFKKDYEPLFMKSVQTDSALPAENDSIGTNHCEAGWNVVRSLKTNPFVADAVLYHHFTPKAVADALPLVKIIFIANTLCYQGKGADHIDLVQTLGISLPADRLDRILAEAEKQTDGLLEDVDLTVEALAKDPSPSHKERDAAVNSIFGEFRKLSVQHLTFEHAQTDSGVVATQKNLLQAFKILFDIAEAFFFTYDPVHDALVGAPAESGPNQWPIGRVELPVATGGNLVALALSHRQIIDSFGYLTNDLITIADEQLVRLLNTEGMLCLPLIHDGRWIGVICAGTDEPQFPLLWEQLDLLNSFAAQAAALLDKTEGTEIRPSSAWAMGEPFDDEAIHRVIHEVNNPLGIVKNYLAVLSEKVAGQPEVKNEIALIREEIERIPGIIAQLSKSRYKTGTDDEVLDVNGIIEDLSKLLTTSVLEHAHITLNFEPDPHLPPCSGNKGHLSQVFINLLKNSAEAMPEGGRIYMTTAYEPDKTGAGGGDIVITIRDDGPGITEKALARLFEPGWSSKGPEHSGLGLSISKDIIEGHNGTISCESRKDKGTTFRITLPVSDRNPQHLGVRKI
ncbi:MAG: HDOD domain-containing protein [Desulfobacterales bacterium]|nr:HDOD domain-containing protein [Desulfobacterales bacterium]